MVRDKNQCIEDCKKDDTYKFLYENKCFIECPNDAPYKDISDMACSGDCLAEDFFLNKCKINNKNLLTKEDLAKKIMTSINEGLLDEYIQINIKENYKDLLYQENDITYQITSSSNYNNNINNISSINLGECENKLKKYYNISNNESLLIFKIDYNIPEYYIPIVEYNIFHPITKEFLDLNICEDTDIILSFPIKKNLEKDTFKYDINSDFYNDKCFPYTSESNTDITLKDRKEIYNKNNLSLCENNCVLENIDTINKQSKCKCEIKTYFEKLTDLVIDKDKLLQHFIDIKSSFNIDVIFCYKTLFKKNEIKNNTGNYIMIFIIGFHLINCIVFYFKGKEIFFSKINYILRQNNFKKNNSNINNSNNINKKKKKKKKKKKMKNKNSGKKIGLNYNNKENINKIETNNPFIRKKKSKKNTIKINNDSLVLGNNKIDNSSSSIKIKNILKTENNIRLQNPNELSNTKIDNKISNYTDNEINSLNYNQAMLIDTRSYFQYYLSLLKTKQMLIFTFYTKNDYNSRFLKISLFLFTFSLYYIVNSLFFQDSEIHEIFENKGKFDIEYQIPKIIYSSLISSALFLFIKYFSLSEKNVIKGKYNNNNEESNAIIKTIKIKFALFFIFTFLLFMFFWYYISCFCAVFRNSQKHLLKDTLISFGFSMMYPLGINFFPGLLRIPALRDKKGNKKTLYNISKIFQFI